MEEQNETLELVEGEAPGADAISAEVALEIAFHEDLEHSEGTKMVMQSERTKVEVWKFRD